jgi:hypothetical protein
MYQGSHEDTMLFEITLLAFLETELACVSVFLAALIKSTAVLLETLMEILESRS